MKFNEKLQSLRKLSGLSQEELADKLGVSRQAVSKWESGSSYPEMDKLVMMTKIFNCTLDDLVNDKLTDQNIVEKKNKMSYLDSFLAFITKTIDMFGNMKFISGIKCLIEMIIVAFILFILSGIILTVLRELTMDLFVFLPESALNITTNIINAIFKLFLYIVCIIILIQTFKSRYLDYYDKALYEYNQKEENKTLKKDDKKNIESKIKKEEKIFINDQTHRPFEFLSGLSKVVIFAFKLIVCFFALFFICSFIFFISGTILSLLFSFDSLIGLGIFLCFLSSSVVNYLILEILFGFIFNKKLSLKRLFIMFISCLVIFGIGISFTIYQFKNINYSNKCDGLNDNIHINEYDMKDNLYVEYYEDEAIYYIIDNSINNIKVNVNYDDRFITMNTDIINDSININNSRSINFSKLYNIIIKDLNNKTIKFCENNYSIKITIISNEENIKKLISNASKYYEVTYELMENGYKVYYTDEIDQYDRDEYNCIIDSNGINTCYEID